jgi:hypothetical protein
MIGFPCLVANKRARLPEARMDATSFSVVLLWLLAALLPLLARLGLGLAERCGTAPAHKKVELRFGLSALLTFGFLSTSSGLRTHLFACCVRVAM